MSVIFAAELLVLCLGSGLFFKGRGHTNTEAAACGIGSVFIVLAGIYQVAGCTGRPGLTGWIEAIGVTAALYLIVRHRQFAAGAVSALLHTVRRHPAAGAGLFLGMTYLAIQGFFLPTEPGHWDALGRVLILQRQIAGTDLLPGISAFQPPLFELPENQGILTQLFIRNQADVGLGLLGLTAFTAIALATYALSRRYAWPPAAMTVTLIAVSCPRFVLGASGPGTALIPAAVGLIGMLCLYRLVEYPNGLDLGLFTLATCFLVGDQTLWLGFPCVLLLLGGVLLFRRHGVLIWANMITARRWTALGFTFAGVFISRLWLYPYNGLVYGRWDVSGRFADLPFNSDGIQGALANAARYLLQSADLPSALDRGIYWLTRFSVSGSLQSLYDGIIYPLFGDRGAAEVFQIPTGSSVQVAWFGPLCFLFLPLAFLYGLRFAPRRLKAVLVALLGYGFLIALIAAWQPPNTGMFCVFYACSIFCIAFFLPPWRLNLNTRRLLRWACFGLFFYTAILNAGRPAFNLVRTPDPSLIGPFGNSIWVQSDWGRERWIGAGHVFGDRRVDRIFDRIESESRLIVFYAKPAAVYPFLLHYPEAAAFPVATLDPAGWAAVTNMQPDGVLLVDCRLPDGIELGAWEIIWQAKQPASKKPGLLLRHR